MTDSAIATGRGRRILAYAPPLAAALAAGAILLLVLVPFGWRLKLWHYHWSFEMVAWAQDLAVAAAVVAALGLVFGHAVIGRRGRLLASALVVLGIATVYVPWQWAWISGLHPPINDITTDTESPPEFVAVLAAREAEQARPAAYGGVGVARQQQMAYPDIAPLSLTVLPQEAFERALAIARAMWFWTIVASDPQKGTIEASATTPYFGFTDDVVIRVIAEGAGSRIDIRSHSRQGGSDAGVNAARVRKYLAALKAAG
jgi:uncharacterized protein (DUF1499 family)